MLKNRAVALAALYRYARLQSALRIKWRRYDEMIDIELPPRGDKNIYQVFSEARKAKKPVALLLGTALESFHPRAAILQLSVAPRDVFRYLDVEVDGEVLSVDLADVQSAVIVEEGGGKLFQG